MDALFSQLSRIEELLLKAAREAEGAMKEAEEELNSILESATEEFCCSSAKAGSAVAAAEKQMEAALAEAAPTIKSSFLSSKIYPLFVMKPASEKGKPLPETKKAPPEQLCVAYLLFLLLDFLSH